MKLKTKIRKGLRSCIKRIMGTNENFGGGGSALNIPPPPSYKQKVLQEYAKEYNCDTLVETGTYMGDTTIASSPFFKQIFTIELSPTLHENAKIRFTEHQNITALCGDSTHVLPDILPQISYKCLFFLDGHYSGGITACGELETPIMAELDIILHKQKSCVIIIDDARCFGFDKDYPTIFMLKRFVHKISPKAEIENYDDMIRIVIG